jgi:tetratricopeptide (TPR) repeat protein/DNA-binding winged helix-turn-helix (wHTH) protein
MSEEAGDNQLNPIALRVDLVHKCLIYEGQNIFLTRRLLKVIKCIHQASPFCAERGTILAAVWGDRSTSADDSNVDKAIDEINKKLLPSRLEIKNEPRLGYRIAYRELDQHRESALNNSPLVEFGETGERYTTHDRRDDHDRLRDSRPPEESSDQHLLLDYDPRDFIGRESYLECLKHVLLAQPTLFLLHGEPGCGKSSLALKFAWTARSSFDAVVFQICGQRTVSEIAAELSTRLKLEQVRSASADVQLAAVRGWLRERPSLLVLDDVWNDDVQMLLPGPLCTVLVTSRRMDWKWIEVSSRLGVENFSTEEIKAYFHAILNDDEVARHWTEILSMADRMGRLPLAISIAARLIRNSTEPVGEVANRLCLDDIEDVSHLLDKAILAQPKHEQELLRAFAACVPEGVWLPFAGSLAGLNSTQMRDAVNQLVNSSLLRPLNRDRRRFQMHTLLREQIRRRADVDEMQERHAVVLEQFFGAWQIRWKECEEVLTEVIPAMDHLWRNGATQRMEQLSASASELGWRNGELEASLRVEIKRESLWNEREGAEAKDKLQRSYGNQALVLKDLGRLEDAMVLHKKEESLCKELGDERSLQICYGNQALILRRMDKREEAMKFLKRQEDICRRLNDKYGLHLSYGNQALILTDWGRLEEALNLLKMMEPMCSELGNKSTLATNYGDQAEILVKLGRIKEAVHLLQQQETLSLELGARSTLGYCYWYWGRAYRAQGDHVAEKQKLQNALNIFIELEMPMEREQVRAEIANISTDSGE